MELSGRACSPNQVLTTYDTYSLVAGTIRPLIASGVDTWFFITADYVFGHSLEDEATRFIDAAGGKVAGRLGSGPSFLRPAPRANGRVDATTPQAGDPQAPDAWPGQPRPARGMIAKTGQGPVLWRDPDKSHVDLAPASWRNPGSATSLTVAR